MAFLELAGLTRRYGPLTVVDAVDLEVELGSLVCLLGPSGCGKTTTPRPMAGLMAPDAGGHLRDLDLGEGPATVIGSSQRVAPRFAAFAKGTGFHADDGNDTQLAVAKDRVVAMLRDLEPLGFIDRLLTPLRF